MGRSPEIPPRGRLPSRPTQPQLTFAKKLRSLEPRDQLVEPQLLEPSADRVELRGAAAALDRRRRDLDRFLVALAAHDPQRTLERGYALVEDAAGAPVASAATARAQPALILRLHDGRLSVRPGGSIT